MATRNLEMKLLVPMEEIKYGVTFITKISLASSSLICYFYYSETHFFKKSL